LSVNFHSLDLPDQDAMLHGLLNQGFPESKDSALFSPEMLDWKFAKSGGLMNSLVGYVENSPVSFYGVLPRQYSFQGVVKTVGLVVDVLSIPAMRGRGLFVSSGQAVMNKLEKTEISCVIGFPIRPEVLPGHLKVGWQVRFPMPVYVYPIGARKTMGWRKTCSRFLFRVMYILFTPLRFTGNSEAQVLNSKEFSSDPRVRKFIESRSTTRNISIQKNSQFLQWRLSRPDAIYKCFNLGEKDTSAYAIIRVMDFEGFQSLAILDVEGSSKKTIKQLMKHVIDYARDERCDLIAFCTNKSNFKRLGLRRFGFLNSPKKFQVISRATGDSDVKFTEKFTRLTWIDSDTI
jgi:hypothetical protein